MEDVARKEQVRPRPERERSVNCSPDEDSDHQTSQQLREALQASENKCREYEAWLSMLDHYAPFELYFKDNSSRYQFINKEFEHTVGKNRDELIGKTPDDIFEEGHAGRVLAMDRKVMTEGLLNRVIPCDLTGTRRSFQETRFPVIDKDGKVLGLGCISQEITKQSVAEEALNRAQSVARIGNWSWSLPNKCLTGCSDTFTELHGVGRGEIFGLIEDKADRAVHPDDRAEYRTKFQNILNDPANFEFEYRLVRPDGSKIYVKETGEVVKNSAGEPIELTGTLQYISALKIVENELRLAHTALEDRIEQRTAALSREIRQRKQIEQDLKLAGMAAESAALEAKATAQSALAASKAKSEFLAMMSHEIRTPLNGILGMVDLLSGGTLDENQNKFVGTIKSSGEELLTVINDILDISRIEAGKLQLDTVEFELLPVVENVVELFDGKAATKGIELCCYIDGSVPSSFIGDPVRLRQVLLNLVSNAVKFTEHGGAVVSVTLAELNGGNASVLFEVIDTGVGIAKDNLDNLFEKFVQADSSSSRKFEGSDLGLAICRELIDLMGSTIDVNSQLDDGSRFWFTIDLPLTPTSTAGSDLRLTNNKVLVIDDHDLSRDVTARYLQSAGADVRVVKNAADGLGEVLRGNFDIVIVDRVMPSMDAVAFLSALQAIKLNKPPKLILSSSTRDASSHIEARELGFEAALAKPVRRSSIESALREIVEHDASKPDSEIKDISAQTQTRRRILLAEDHPVNQVLATTQLERNGYEVDVAVNGMGAIQMFEAGSYQIILMDVRMPLLDGLDATRHLRTSKTGRNIPIIAMTANAMPGDEETCRSAGMDDYVIKPIDWQEFNHTIARWMKSGRSTITADCA